MTLALTEERAETAAAQSLGPIEIQALLPHRYPFLLLDKVVDYLAGERLLGQKAVSINEPYFQGHFPGNPVMPGVLITEALAQATMALFILSNPAPNESGRHLMLAQSTIQFRKPVIPGDLLHLEITVERLMPRAIAARTKARVDGKLAAKGDLLLMSP